jgi:HEAT repeat protein
MTASVSNSGSHRRPWQQRLLELINLRPEEQERTWLMFAAYTATSMGILWLEVSSAALFLDQYGAANLPWIYIFSALVGLGLSLIYSWLQRFLPLRQALVVMALVMATPILLFRWGLTQPAWVAITVFLMRLWIEAIYGLNELNLSVTANQLFNIREVKRAFPIISSGIQIADMISGFSIYFLLTLFGLQNVMLLAFGAMVAGALLLYYLSHSYAHAFPDSPKYEPEVGDGHAGKSPLQGALRQYIVLLCAFFVLAQMLLFSTEFQFFNQLEMSLGVNEIATFLGIFSGLLGLIELLTQWFSASRLIERRGVFTAALVLPLVIIALGLFTLLASLPQLLGAAALFLGVVLIKFLDEWLRYTLVATIRPVLFQPIPRRVRSTVQSLVAGMAEPLAMGATGLVILLVIRLANRLGLQDALAQAQLFLLGTVVAALVWFAIMALLRSRYLNLLVQGAERGLDHFSDADLRAMKQNLVDALAKPQSESEQRYCIDLLCQVAPREAGDVLAPRLLGFSPALQQRSLEAMLLYPNPSFVNPVKALVEDLHQSPAVFALALRYLWQVQEDNQVEDLKPYLQPQVDAMVRGTAAALMLRYGNRQQRVEAMASLRKMLTHEQERERVMGCRALADANYMESLSIYMDSLLQDPSLRVRRATLAAIAATQYGYYYPALLKALQYPSTRAAARQALTSLGDEAIPMLISLGLDASKPDSLRYQAWQVIGEIGSLPALETLIHNLLSSWGSNRRQILAVLLKLYQQTGLRRSPLIDNALDQMLGRSGMESLLTTELEFLCQLLAARADLDSTLLTGTEADLMRSALTSMESDALDRVFLVLRFMAPGGTIQAAQTSLSGSPSRWARGLEILDNSLDSPSKATILILFDRRPDRDKLKQLASITPGFQYRPMAPRDRLRHLLDLRAYLSDWGLACCFHLARANHWNLTTDHTLALLQHPTGFVREAVLAYLAMASPRVLSKILPLMEKDPDPLVASQLAQLATVYNRKT